MIQKMENLTQAPEETTVNETVTETVQEETTTGQHEPAIEEPKSELEKMIQARTGLFEVPLTIDDVKWLKNQCNSKFSFKGPNDAFMLMTVYFGLDSCLQHYAGAKEVKSVKLTAGTIEGLAVLVQKYEGTGVPAAQKVFNVAVGIQSAIGQMRALDQQIDTLEKAMQAANEEPQTEQPTETAL